MCPVKSIKNVPILSGLAAFLPTVRPLPMGDYDTLRYFHNTPELLVREFVSREIVVGQSRAGLVDGKN
jgi:hypothetical protein